MLPLPHHNEIRIKILFVVGRLERTVLENQIRFEFKRRRFRRDQHIGTLAQ